MLALYDGDVMNLYEAARHRLRGEGGILQRLTAFDAYSDPVEKKSFLFIMFAYRCGAWEIEDLEHLEVAIDYHIMRVALRSGMVRVTDPDLERILKERLPLLLSAITWCASPSARLALYWCNARNATCSRWTISCG